MLQRRLLGAALAVVVLLAAMLFVHPEIGLQGKIYSSSDSQAAQAFRSAGDAALEAGEFPHWNPFVFAGMPSYSSLAYTPGTYPLTGPIQTLRDALGLPAMSWLLVHYLICALGVTGWLRWRCHSWPVAIAGGALILALPKLAAWGAYGHGTKMGTFAWMPWALWFTEALLRQGRLVWVAALASVVSMMLLRAHVQITYYAVLAIGVFVLTWWAHDLRDPERRRTVLTRTAWIAVAGVVALGVALVLVLPILEYQSHSIRGAASQGGGAAFQYATGWSLSWAEIGTLWWPTTAGFGRGAYVGGMPFTDYPNYIGMPLMLLGLFGFVVRRDRTTWALMILAVLSVLIALGDNFFLYRVLYEVLPGFNKFRVPSMILAVQELAVIVMAMNGLDALMSMLAGGSRPRWLGRPLLVVGGSVALVLLLLGSVGADALRDAMATRWADMAASFQKPTPPGEAVRAAADLAVGDALRLGGIVLAGLILSAAVAMRRIPPAYASGVLALLLFLDLWRVQQPVLRPADRLPQARPANGRMVAVESESLVREAQRAQDYTAADELTAWLLDQSDRPRVFPIGGWENDNRLAARQIVSLGGYHAAKLQVYETLRRRMYDPQRPAFELANLLGAEWVVTSRPFSQQVVEQIRQLGLDLEEPPAHVSDGGTVYANRSAMPRAWLVGSVERELPDRDTTGEEPSASLLDRVLSPRFDPRTRAVVSDAPDPVPEPESVSGSVSVVEERYNGVTLRVDTPADGLLVVGDVWYPQWKVTVDGEPARLLRADYLLRAVAVSAGQHEVEFTFDDTAHRTGRAASRVALLLILVGFAVEPVQHWRRRNAADTPDDGEDAR